MSNLRRRIILARGSLDSVERNLDEIAKAPSADTGWLTQMAVSALADAVEETVDMVEDLYAQIEALRARSESPLTGAGEAK